MSTCKDCIHGKVCTGRALGGFWNAEKECRNFKDRSKFIELPCNIGQTVYAYCEDLHEILEYRIYCASVFRENSITYHADCYNEENDEALSEIGFEPDDIGEFVFFTREEVEQALKEREKE